MEHVRILVNSPSVVSEVIEGEAVIMNLTTGQYFSCLGVGGEIWTLIEGGATRAQILGQIEAHYTVDAPVLSASFDAFMASLQEHDLVRTEPTGAGDGNSAGTNPSGGQMPGSLPESPKGPFHEPILNVYSDMEDLLLLDPIHDVDETGWPQPKPPEDKAQWPTSAS